MAGVYGLRLILKEGMLLVRSLAGGKPLQATVFGAGAVVDFEELRVLFDGYPERAAQHLVFLVELRGDRCELFPIRADLDFLDGEPTGVEDEFLDIGLQSFQFMKGVAMQLLPGKVDGEIESEVGGTNGMGVGEGVDVPFGFHRKCHQVMYQDAGQHRRFLTVQVQPSYWISVRW